MTTLRTFTAAASAAVLAALASLPAAAAGTGDPRVSGALRLAMMDDMPMGTQPQAGMGQGGGMMHDMMMGGMQQGHPGQMDPGTMQPRAGMGQGGGMMDDDMMGMQQGQMPGMGMRTMPGMAPSGADLTDRIEGRIAFLRTELGINDAQAAAWDQFAEALRGSRKHLLEARQALDAGMPAADAAARLQQYEQHVAARLEAIKMARTSFAQLYAVLDDQQKATADELLVPFIATF